MICSREEAELDYFTPPRVYRLREGGDMAAFRERLKREYAPKIWEPTDKANSLSVAYIFMDRAMILSTTSVHFAAIEKRYAKELVRCRASEDSFITPAVERKIDVAFHDAELSAVADWFAKELKLKVELDKNGLDNASIGADTLVRVPALRQVRVSTVLDIISSDHVLGWYVEHSHIPSMMRLVITSLEETQIGENQAYAFDVRELVDDGDVDGLLDLLVSAIRPDSWEEGGGPARDLLFVAPGYLIVSNSYAIQRDIARFLSELRCAMNSK